MNALQLIDRVRAHGAELVLDGERLVVRGSGEPLPAEIRDELAAHKAELLIALGVPFDRTVESILASIRPHLSPALKRLSDGDLLALVNWNIIAAWEATVRKAGAP
jgi:TubC N-terminal docking domain